MHVSGCARRCGAPRAAHVDAVALAGGGYLVDGVPRPDWRRDASYVRDGAEIYRRSFATIRAEADLDGLPPTLAPVAVRMIHACGQVDLVDDVALLPGRRRRGARARCRRARRSSATRRWSPRASPARGCPPATTSSARCATRGSRRSRRELGTTRTAAALELWRDRLGGAVVAIGNAPTALFHLLELIDAGAPRPAAVLGVPVGFIGAAESKEALADRTDLEYLVVHGRRGGSAITAAAVNALASERGDLTDTARLYGVGARPRRPRAGHGQGRPADRRRRRDRLPLRRGTAAASPAAIADAAPARRPDRGARWSTR